MAMTGARDGTPAEFSLFESFDEREVCHAPSQRLDGAKSSHGCRPSDPSADGRRGLVVKTNCVDLASW